MAVSKADIFDALSVLAESSKGLNKKPNVSTLEELLGEDITAKERDDAWKEFLASKPVEEPESVEVAEVAEVEAKHVTNNYKSAINVCGVTIEVGQTKIIHKFKANKVIEKWISEDVITVK